MVGAAPAGVAFPIGSVQEGTYAPSGTTMTDLSSGRGTSGFGDWGDSLSPEEYADQVMKYEAEEAASAARLAEEEAAMAALEGEEAALVEAEAVEEALMGEEALAGPFGWIAEAITAAALLGTAAKLAYDMLEEGELQKQIASEPAIPRPGPRPPQPGPIPIRPVIDHTPNVNTQFGGFYPLTVRRRRRKLV